ncbi:MAG: hypothetical protein ACR2IF_19190 [Terriglobales bacterium]
MGSKVVNTVVIAAGVVVLAVLAFIVVGLIGEGLAAIFTHGGLQGGSARAIGGSLAILAALVLLAVFFRTRRKSRLSAHISGHPHHKHTA